MKTFEDVIADFGGPARFAEAIGIKDFHAQTMKTRGSIPPGYWNAVVAGAAARGIQDITLETLAAIAAAKAGRDVPLAPEAQGEPVKAAG